MDLELSDGTIIRDVDRPTLEAKIESLGSGTEHLILEDGEAFIQAAGGPVEMMVQYNTGQGMMESSSGNVDSGTVKRIFSAFLEGKEGWKELISFQPVDGGPAPAGVSGSAGGAAQSSREPGSPLPNVDSLKNNLLNSVKREAGNSFGYMVRRAIRRFLRRIF
jgi:hypothetical protein